MNYNFYLYLPNIYSQQLQLILILLITILFLITARYTYLYKKTKYKIIKNTIQNISKLPNQILLNSYKKDKKLLLNQDGKKFCLLLVLFITKWYKNIDDYIKKTSKKDFFAKIYKGNLNNKEIDDIKSIIKNKNII